MLKTKIDISAGTLQFYVVIDEVACKDKIQSSTYISQQSII